MRAEPGPAVPPDSSAPEAASSGKVETSSPAGEDGSAVFSPEAGAEEGIPAEEQSDGSERQWCHKWDEEVPEEYRRNGYFQGNRAAFARKFGHLLSSSDDVRQIEKCAEDGTIWVARRGKSQCWQLYFKSSSLTDKARQLIDDPASGAKQAITYHK